MRLKQCWGPLMDWKLVVWSRRQKVKERKREKDKKRPGDLSSERAKVL